MSAWPWESKERKCYVTPEVWEGNRRRRESDNSSPHESGRSEWGRRRGRMSGGRWRRRRLTGGGKEARWPQGAGRTLSGLLNAGGRRVPARGPRVTLTVAHPVQWSPPGQQVCPVQRQLVLGGQPRPRCDLHRPGEDLPPPLPPACTASSSALHTKVIGLFVLSAWQVCRQVAVTAGVWAIVPWCSQGCHGNMHGCGREFWHPHYEGKTEHLMMSWKVWHISGDFVLRFKAYVCISLLSHALPQGVCA